MRLSMGVLLDKVYHVLILSWGIFAVLSQTACSLFLGMGESNCSWNRKALLHRDTMLAAAAVYRGEPPTPTCRRRGGCAGVMVLIPQCYFLLVRYCQALWGFCFCFLSEYRSYLCLFPSSSFPQCQLFCVKFCYVRHSDLAASLGPISL